MWHEITFTLPAYGQVDAHFRDFVVPTDHPPARAREGRAPEPFALFLASIGTCVASFVADYLQEHDLPLTDVRLVQRQSFTGPGPDRTIPAFEIQIVTPPGFPEGHRDALVAAAEACTVKRVIQALPEFRIMVSGEDGASRRRA